MILTHGDMRTPRNASTEAETSTADRGKHHTERWQRDPSVKGETAPGRGAPAPEKGEDVVALARDNNLLAACLIKEYIEFDLPRPFLIEYGFNYHNF
jgi:hypothetical protein